MKAIIVAGGRGERLKPLTNNIPKPMIDINGKPMLLHIVELLNKYGVSEFIFALCYLPDVITNFFGDGKKFGVKIEYTYENTKKPLGTAGAITLAKNLIDETFIVTYADILRDLDIKKMIQFHKKNKSFITINVYKRESNNAKSKVMINDKNRVIKFIERPTEDELIEDYVWRNGSFYILEPETFEYIPKKRKSDFGKDIFPKILSKGKKLFAYPSDGYFVDIGNLNKLEYADKTFKSASK